MYNNLTELTEESFEKRIDEILKVRVTDEQSLASALHPEFVSISEEKKELVLSYTLKPWMKNHYGILHGGITCSILDTSMGILSQAVTGKRMQVTSNLQVNFLRGVEMDKKVFVKAKAEHVGKATVSLYARLWQGEDESLCSATGTGTFFIIKQ